MDFTTLIAALFAVLTTLVDQNPTTPAAPTPQPPAQHQRQHVDVPDADSDEAVVEPDDGVDFCTTLANDPSYEAVPDDGQTQEQADAELAAFCEED